MDFCNSKSKSLHTLRCQQAAARTCHAARKLPYLITLDKKVRSMQAVMHMMANGTVRPPEPRRSFELADAKAAVEEAQRVFPGGRGKVMLSS